MWTQQWIWTYCYKAITADVHNGGLRNCSPSRNIQNLTNLTHLLCSWNRWYGENFSPISKGCPFAFSTVDRLDFFSSKPPKALCLITLWHFPHCLGMVAGLRFKNQAMPFNFYQQFVQFMVCCQGQNPVSLSDSSLLSSSLTLKDKIWSRWNLIFNIKLRPWSQSIQNAINHIFNLPPLFLCTFHMEELTLITVKCLPAALSRGFVTFIQ